MSHWIGVQLFPENFLLLQKEVSHHPRLIELLANHPAGELEIKLAEIATYCDVALNGTYTPDDLGKLAGILEKKLKDKRPADDPYISVVQSIQSMQ